MDPKRDAYKQIEVTVSDSFQGCKTEHVENCIMVNPHLIVISP